MPDLRPTLARAEAGDEPALREVIDAARRLTAADEAVIATLLQSARPELRAAACAQIGRTGVTRWFDALVPRMSDNDWRVRAAAFEAAQALARDVPALQRDAPLRDTPVDERERFIADALKAWRDAGKAMPEACELYLPPGHWLAGERLGESCLACHAPPAASVSASARCLSCHQDVEPAWGPSAHAWTTTHMRLARIDPKTKLVVAWDHGDRKGVGCVACHAPQDGTSGFDADHPFARGIASTSCAACHVDEQQQWEAWRSREHPIAATWPPGEITVQSAADSSSCVGCHVPSGSGALGHAFAARRDVGFLQRGLGARLEAGKQGTQLVLTNLSGHEYPTGTVRRALRVEAMYDDDPATRRVIARLAPAARVPTSQPSDGALAVAEERRIAVPVPSGAMRMTVEVVYERNRFVAGSYEVAIHRLAQDLTSQPGGPRELSINTRAPLQD
jgi:hypothetical protein